VSKRIKIGPFHQAAIAVENIAYNFYHSMILMKALDEHEKIMEGLELACLAEDREEIKRFEIDLSIIERAIQLSAPIEEISS
jgi:hypothetical protein